MDTPASRAELKSFLIPVAVPLFILWVARFLPFFDPQGRFWGFDHLLFLSSSFTVMYALAGAMIPLLAFPVFRSRLCRFFDALAKTLLEQPAFLRWSTVAALSVVIFWIVRLPVSLLGDGYSVIHNISAEIPVIVKWSEMGAIRIVQAVSLLVPVTGLERGEYAYAVVSVLSGGVTVFFFLGLAYEQGRDRRERLFTFCLLVFSGWLLLFFGYPENYPVLWPVATGYIYFSFRYLHGHGRLIWPLLFLAAALVLHLQTAFLLLSLPYLIVSRGAMQSWYRQHRRLILVIMATAVVVLVIVIAIALRRSLLLRSFFLPLFSGHPLTPDYFLFSPHHLLDIVSEITLLIPLWPLLLTIGLGHRRQVFGNPIGLFLSLVSCGGVLMLVGLEPKLGMGRDWDLFALTGLGPMLLLARVLITAEKIRPLYPILAASAFVLTLPFWVTNANRGPAIAYYESLLKLDHRQSRPGMWVLRDYYYDQGDSARGEAIDWEIYNTFAPIRQARRANELSKTGEFAPALALADSVWRADPYSAEGYNLLGLVYSRRKIYDSAIANLKISVTLAPYDYRTWLNLAMAYHNSGRSDTMMIDLRCAQKLNPHIPIVLESMAMAFMTMRQFDSCLAYGRALQQRDTTYSKAYLAIGVGLFTKGDMAGARENLAHFVQVAPHDADWREAKGVLEQIEARINAPPKR